MKRQFVQDRNVTSTLRRNGVMDAELRDLENAIMRGEGVTLAGTAGLKKIRCASFGRGKSGSVRIIFADYPRAGRIYLLAAFGKDEMANLNKAQRNGLRRLKQALDRIMERLVKNEG